MSLQDLLKYFVHCLLWFAIGAAALAMLIAVLVIIIWIL